MSNTTNTNEVKYSNSLGLRKDLKDDGSIGIIRDVKITNEYDDKYDDTFDGYLSIFLDDREIIFSIEENYGSFMKISKYNKITYKDLIGKKLMSIEEKNRYDYDDLLNDKFGKLINDKFDEDEFGIKVYDSFECNIVYTNIEIYSIKLMDEPDFVFGYFDNDPLYNGYLEVSVNKTYVNPQNNNTFIIIIIGLSGSGKTTYSKKLEQSLKHNRTNDKENKIYLFDDVFNSYQSTKHEIINIISYCDEKTIIMNDPRLCDSSIFEKFITELNKYVLNDKIKLIMFENEPDKCIQNINNREKQSKYYDINKTNNLIERVNNLSEKYSLDNPIYTQFEKEIISVYQPN